MSEHVESPKSGGAETFGYRAVLEASPNAIVAVDGTAQITYVNPQVEKTFGYAPDELLGQPVEILLPGRVAERHVAHRDAFIAHPGARPMGIGLDLSGRRKDGREFPVEISLSPVETADGLQVFATVVDITARKAAETQLVQAQKLESIGRLAGGIAHDFNNMLFAILGYAELLSQDLSPDRHTRLDVETARKSVDGIGHAAERAATLTQQLLAFSRKQVVSPKVLDLNEAVRSVEPMLRRLIGENLTLVVKLDPAASQLRADPGQLDQILVNLVVNARDAMPDGGTVTIETGTAVFDEPYPIEHFEVIAGSYVLLAVSDTGHGMDFETRQHVFEPFYTTKEVGKGTGLGLATIYGIVRQASGYIWLYSEPGHGSTFKLYFPRVDAKALEALGPEAAPSSQGAGTILVGGRSGRPGYDQDGSRTGRLPGHRCRRWLRSDGPDRGPGRTDRRPRDRCRDAAHVRYRAGRARHRSLPRRRHRSLVGLHRRNAESRADHPSWRNIRGEAGKPSVRSNP